MSEGRTKEQWENVARSYQKHITRLQEENEKLKAQIEEMEKEKCELLGIIQKKDNFIDKIKCCENCKYKQCGVKGIFKEAKEKDKTKTCDEWELAE
jgi:predicted RNase H-like nuclease (RuvC/YqgF family)